MNPSLQNRSKMHLITLGPFITHMFFFRSFFISQRQMEFLLSNFKKSSVIFAELSKIDQTVFQLPRRCTWCSSKAHTTPSQDARSVIKLKQNIVENCVVVLVQKFSKIYTLSGLFLASIFRTRFLLLSSSRSEEIEGGEGGQLGKVCIDNNLLIWPPHLK